MLACIHTYIQTYIHTYRHTYIHVYTHTHILYSCHMYTHTYIHTYTLRPSTIRKSATNIKLTNVWMMLRKCCNHPYLLEFPMTPEGEFRIDEDLVTCCGKVMLLDRLLSALISRGHKVSV